MLIDIIGLLFTAQLGSAAPAKTTPPAPGPTAAPAKLAANDVVDQVQKFYGGIEHVTVQFEQSVKNTTFGDAKTSSGQMWIEKPGKMRWDYHDKKGNTKTTFIANGSKGYVIERDNEQVVKKNLQQDMMPVAVTFLYGKGDLKAEFNAAIDTASSYGSKGDYVLKLTPKKPSAQYKSLYLVADPTQFRVKESVIIDASNNVNHFQFFAPDFQKPIDSKKTFEFDEKSVPNYRIVDGDAPQQKPADRAAPAPVAPKK